MRDPTTWALPLFRVFGARVKIHALYLLAPLLFCRFLIEEKPGLTFSEWFIFVVLLPIPILLIHELGHLFAARSLGGDSREIVIAPLGSLVPPDVQGPKAQAIVALAGPLASLLLCIVLTSISVGAGYSPSVLPFNDPVSCPSIHATSGRVYTVLSKPIYYQPGTTERVANPKFNGEGLAVDPEKTEMVLERGVLPPAIAWLWRANWLGIWLVTLNLLVWSLPLDAGRIVVAVAASKTNDTFRASVNAARFSILLCVPCLFVIAIIQNESLLLVLTAVVLAANARLVASAASASENEAEDKPFGYDFSQGYTSLETEEINPAKTPKVGFWERRRRAKEAERIRKEADQDQRDAARIDELLDKIQRLGSAALSSEEKAFLDRASLRYRDQL